MPESDPQTTRAYTIGQLAALAGVSVRTLHHYDQIGLLVPSRTPNGYRRYTRAEVDRLQLILLYREMDMPLERIARCLDAPDTVPLLREQRARLVAQRDTLDQLIATVTATIAEKEGGPVMEDQEKFEGFKRRLVEENERDYGAEARDKYGDDAVDASNAKLMGMTPEQYAATQDLSAQIAEGLRAAMVGGDPASPEAQHVCDLHRRWLCAFWKDGAYSKQAHAGLAEMYVADERFKAHYDAIAPGAAQFLHDALLIYCAS